VSERGDFHGEPTLVLESGELQVELLAEAGPRLVRLRLAEAGDNLLGEVPDLGWETPWGEYRLRGGHRLWFAPENPPLTSAPDEGGLEIAERPNGLRLERLEPQSRLRKTIEVELAADTAALTLRHGLRNEGEAPVRHAPWAITVLPPGGVAVLPQQRGPIGASEFLPNRSLVLWPYSSIADPRLVLGDELVLVHADPAPRFKIGYLNRAGWAGYLRDGVFFCKRFDPEPELEHADLGCNVEAYCNDRLLELETLAPLSLLEPGGEAWLEERWQIFRLEKTEVASQELPGLLGRLGLG
jgi:hypothetical protein